MSINQYIKTFNPKRQFMDIANSYGGLDLIDYIHATDSFFDNLKAKIIESGYGSFFTLNATDFTSENGNIDILASNLIKLKGNSYLQDKFFVGLKAGNLTSSTIYTLPLQDGGSGQSLLTDGNANLYWDYTSGSGDVVGPSYSTNNAIALWDGISGSLLKNSNVIIDFAGNVTTPGSILANKYIIKNNVSLNLTQSLAQISDITFVLPPNTGLANQVLTTDGTGILSFTSIGGGSGGAPNDATYILQTPSGGLPNAQILSNLQNGILFNTSGSGILTAKTKIDLSNLPPLHTTYVPDLGGFAPQIYAGTESGEVEVSNQLGIVMGDLELLNIWKLTGSFIVASGIPGFSFPSGQRLEELTRGGLLRTTRAGDVPTPTQPAGAGFLRTASPGVDYLDGPSNSTNNAIVLWDGTNGMKIKNSSVLIDANANISEATSVTCSGKLSGARLELTNNANGAAVLKAANNALNLNWTLPATQGSTNQVLTLLDNIGNTTWSDNSGGDVKRNGDTADNHIALWSGVNQSVIKNSSAVIDLNGNLTLSGNAAANNFTANSDVTAKNLIMKNLANLTLTAGNNNTNITLQFPNTGGSDGDVLTRSGAAIGNTYNLSWSKSGGNISLEGNAISNHVAIFGSSEYQIKDSGVNISTIKGYADSAKESAEAAAASAEEAAISAAAAEASAGAAAGAATEATGSAAAAAASAIAAGLSALDAGVNAALAKTRADNAKISEDNAKNSADEAQNALDTFLNTDLTFTGNVTGQGLPGNNINLQLNTINSATNKQFLQAAVNGGNLSLQWANGSSGGGDVIGPSTSVLYSVALWNNITGSELKDCNVIISNDNITTPGTMLTSALILPSNLQSNNLILKANSNMTANIELIFPTDQGLPGQILTTDGAGNLYWSNKNNGNYVIGPSSSNLNALAVFGSINGAILLNSNISFSNNDLTLNRIKANKLVFN